jgi:hypothetical protein
VVKLLIENDADFNSKNINNLNPIYLSAQTDNYKALEFLSSLYKIDINIKDNDN